MSAMASQTTSLTIVYSAVYSGADHRKHQSSASLAFVREIHRWPVNSPHKGPVTRKMFSFDDVIMKCSAGAWAPLWQLLQPTENGCKTCKICWSIRPLLIIISKSLFVWNITWLLNDIFTYMRILKILLNHGIGYHYFFLSVRPVFFSYMCHSYTCLVIIISLMSVTHWCQAICCISIIHLSLEIPLIINAHEE